MKPPSLLDAEQSLHLIQNWHSHNNNIMYSHTPLLIYYYYHTIINHSLLWSVEQSSTINRVSDVEGMVIRAVSRDCPSIDEESVCSFSLHNQLWDDSVVDIPGNTPTSLSYIRDCNRIITFQAVQYYALNLACFTIQQLSDTVTINKCSDDETNWLGSISMQSWIILQLSPVMAVYPLGFAAGPMTATKVASSRMMKLLVGNGSHCWQSKETPLHSFRGGSRPRWRGALEPVLTQPSK